MASVTGHVRPEEARQSAEHVLFVEGKDESCIDPVVLEELLRGAISVKALGSSFHIRSATEALHRHHPRYYFLIDRDHYDDAFVEKSWDSFPDPATANLLVWRRRELENYFIIPEYAAKSSYLRASEDLLRRTILDCCRERLFFDAANQVVVLVREEFKTNWVEQFPRVTEFPSREAALVKLAALPELVAKRKSTSRLLSQREIAKLFCKVLAELTGGKERLEFGRGRWLELLKGKGVLPEVVNRCFRVKAARGKVLQGPQRVREVAKDLVRMPIQDQPDDFQNLVRMISGRLTTKDGALA